MRPWAFTAVLISLLLPATFLAYSTVKGERARLRQFATWQREVALKAEQARSPTLTNIQSGLWPERYGPQSRRKYCDDHDLLLREVVWNVMLPGGCKEVKLTVCPEHYRKALDAYLRFLCDRTEGGRSRKR